MSRKITIEDLALGKCPSCFEFVTFVPTKKKDIFVCEVCDDKIRQYKNGKIHWYKYTEEPIYKIKD